MNTHSSKKQANPRNLQEWNQTSSAGPNGVAIVPPVYGLASIDHRLLESQASANLVGGIVAQRQADVANARGEASAQSKNKTGLPDQLKTGVESLSGFSLNEVRVHYNSSKPTRLNALAYTQGTEIHIAPGQERHLPHEAWHVVQQKQGRVKPTFQLNGEKINDDKGLEHEANLMGTNAVFNMPLNRSEKRLSNVRLPIEVTGSFTGLHGTYNRAIQLKNGFDKLVETKGGKYKKKEKERSEQARVERILDQQIRDWIENYGHAIERHAGLTTAQLDGRNIPLATTFDTNDDLFNAAKSLISENEQKLNAWYQKDEGERLELWNYRDDEVSVRGRRKLARPAWHHHVHPMPVHPGYQDVAEDELGIVIGVFDRDAWSRNPKGLVTCFPSDSKP